MRPSSCSASRRFARPSSWIFITSSSVEISVWFVFVSVSISTMPRSDSRAVSTVAVFSISALRLSSSLVASVTSRWALAASFEWFSPTAITIWVFHRGIVFTSVDWIFSDMMVSLFCTSRICGAICRDTMRVSSRSWSFLSKRSQSAERSLAAWVSSGSPLRRAFSTAAGSSDELTCSSFFLPARIYMDNSFR